MTTAVEAKEFQARLERLDQLLAQIKRLSDPAVQANVQAVVQAILELHGIGLERILEHMAEAGDAGREILDTCAGDEMVGGLFLLHDLHPLDLEARVGQALDDVRPYLHSHAGNVELVAVEGDAVRLRLEGSCDGCPSSAVTMRQTIEEAISRRAPDVRTVEVESLPDAPAPQSNGRSRIVLPLV
jgi:Fe-S cluster biogenesis protein NfuA